MPYKLYLGYYVGGMLSEQKLASLRHSKKCKKSSSVLSECTRLGWQLQPKVRSH